MPEVTFVKTIPKRQQHLSILYDIYCLMSWSGTTATMIFIPLAYLSATDAIGRDKGRSKYLVSG